jgi:glycosyltransferase involved in cell wall biosynthesis
MKKINLSVVMAVFNEELNIGRCLESVRKIADEIIIVDGQSTDKTVAIAKKYHARVISVPNLPNFHTNKNIAIDAAGGKWIFQLDADEVVSPDLAQEITRVIKSEKYNGYWLNRKNWFLSRFLTKGGQYPDPTLRLYKKGFGRLPAETVHEQAVVTGPTGHLKNDLLHYRDINFETYMLRFNRYTSLMASEMTLNHTPLNLWTLFSHLAIKPFITFFSLYLRHRGYVDGFPGFVFALFSGLRFGVAYIKYWQITKYPNG